MPGQADDAESGQGAVLVDQSVEWCAGARGLDVEARQSEPIAVGLPGPGEPTVAARFALEGAVAVDPQ